LTFTDAVSLVVGIIIGAGIFLVPNLIARAVPDGPSMMATWIVGGILSFFGALAFAEMAAMLPSTGGQYVYLREAYGPLAAFLCSWTFFFVSMTASMAWLAMSFTIYLRFFVPLDDWTGKAAGVALSLILTYINYRGVRAGAWVQKILTGAKLAGILLIVVAAFLTPATPTPPSSYTFRFADFGVALIACLLALDGWNNVSFVAGEIRDPQKNLSRAILTGTLIVVAVYLLTNLAYLRILPPNVMATTERVGATVAARALGPAGASVVAGIILLSITGSLNGRVLTQARMYFAQAQDGLFFARFGEPHPRYQTPSFALWLQAAWTCALILTSTWEALVDYALFAIWLFYTLTVAGVIVLRKKRPDLPRPYRMWGYPVTPVLFVSAAVWFVVNTAIERPAPSLTALGLIASGIPAFWLWRRFANPAS
jgi:APA family basic amino acid/polyamine antiporter